MDSLLLAVLAFGILAGTSFFAAFRQFRGGQPEAAIRWLNRAGWFFILMGLGVFTGILPHISPVNERVATAHYFFLLFTFGLMVGAGRFGAWLLDIGDNGAASIAVSSFLILVAGFVCYCISIPAELFFRVVPISHLIVGLFGLWIGLRPAIQKYQMTKAVNRLRAERGGSTTS